MNKKPTNGGKSDELSLNSEKKDKRGKHPNSQANLKPYVTGRSGNPNGQSRIWNMSKGDESYDYF